MFTYFYVNISVAFDAGVSQRFYHRCVSVRLSRVFADESDCDALC